MNFNDSYNKNHHSTQNEGCFLEQSKTHSSNNWIKNKKILVVGPLMEDTKHKFEIFHIPGKLSIFIDDTKNDDFLQMECAYESKSKFTVKVILIKEKQKVKT